MSNVQTEEEQQLDQGGIAALREAARKGSAATEENTDLKRRLQFLEAGIDLKHEVGEMLYKSWDGSNFEELVAKATRLGAMKGTEPPATKEPTPEELAQAAADAERQRMQEQMGGGGQPGGQLQTGAHPRDTAREEYHRDVRDGKDPDAARDEAFAKVLGAGHVLHDPRMRFDQEAWTAAGVEADRAAMRGATGRSL